MPYYLGVVRKLQITVPDKDDVQSNATVSVYEIIWNVIAWVFCSWRLILKLIWILDLHFHRVMIHGISNSRLFWVVVGVTSLIYFTGNFDRLYIETLVELIELYVGASTQVFSWYRETVYLEPLIWPVYFDSYFIGSLILITLLLICVVDIYYNSYNSTIQFILRNWIFKLILICLVIWHLYSVKSC